MNHGTHSRAPKKNTSHGNEVLPQDTTHLIQRPVNNEEVRAKIQQAIGPHEDLLTISEGSGEQGKMDKTGCKIICGAPSTLTVKGLMMLTFVLCFRIIYCNLWQGKCYPPFDGAI